MSKAASNRTWTKHYHVIKSGQICVYKDQKQFKDSKAIEAPINLAGASAEEAKDYKKRHCFRLRLADGAEYLFKTKDDAEMNAWLENIKAAIGIPEASSTMTQSSRAQTLPPTPAGEQEKKKGGFFTLKRK